MRIKSVKRGSIFEYNEVVKTPLSRHNLSYPTRFDCEMGQLIPFYIQDVSPGYNMMAKAALFGRMMPTITPIMQDIDVEVRYFFVPNRLVWKNFEDYILRVGDHVHPFIELEKDVTLPYLVDLISNAGNETVVDDQKQHDYNLCVDALPYRAYDLIWNEFFRDQNVQNEIDFGKDYDGQYLGIDELSIHYCDWKKDYFTSALPWTQRGDMAQFIGDVYLKKNSYGVPLYSQLIKNSAGNNIRPQNGDSARSTTALLSTGSGILTPAYGDLPEGPKEGEMAFRELNFGEENDEASRTEVTKAFLDPNGTFAVSFGINELRMANAVQKFLERSAIAGNRYTEYIMGMFGVHCSDSRLQRPEYLGGGKVPFMVSEVMQNEQAQLDSEGSPYDGSTPQGNLAGIGKANGILGFNKPTFFPEYGWVIGLLYLRPKALYMNGVSRRHIIGAFDGVGAQQFESYEIYLNPFFDHLGEQAVFNVELYADADEQDNFGSALAGRTKWDKTVFGYQSQNAYRKYRNGEVHGEFRSTLKHWTLAREFSNTPTLSDQFLKCNPSKRIFAVEDDSNHFIFDVYNIVDAVLPTSAYSTPSL